MIPWSWKIPQPDRLELVETLVTGEGGDSRLFLLKYLYIYIKHLAKILKPSAKSKP
jgi:hypothetical protein